MGLLIIAVLFAMLVFIVVRVRQNRKKNQKKKEVSLCTGECSKCGRCH